MSPKGLSPCYLAFVLLILAACGPAGPALGLGPALDQFVGPVLVLVLVVGGLSIAKAVTRSRSGQAIGRQVSETASTVGKPLRAAAHAPAGTQEGQDGDITSHAEEILRERYARGEIDRKQYLEMLNDLKGR